MDPATTLFPPMPMFVLSPTTRRRNRGRGTVVFDNLTEDSQMNNGQTTGTTVPGLLNSLQPPPGLLLPETPSDLNTSALVDGLLLPTPSPDEMIIQARGRRRGVPLTFSPDVHTTPVRGARQQQRSLSGLVLRNGTEGSEMRGISRLMLPTRTSPRKRLTLTDSPPSSGSNRSYFLSSLDTPSPDKSSKRSPVSKKMRRTPSDKVDPTVHMKSLNQCQLAAVVTALLDKHPELEDEVSDLLPPSDLAPMEVRLLHLKRNISRSLPNTRLESKTDSLAYNRASGHLVEFKRALTDQSKTLLDAQQWSSCVDHCMMSWSYVRATPVWDNPPHNNVRKGLLKMLAQNALAALKKGRWTEKIATELREKLSTLEKDCEADIKACVKQLDQIIEEAK